jgi:hypothetical protein
MRGLVIFFSALLVAVCVIPGPSPSVQTAAASAPATHHRHLTVRVYARQLVLHRWHSVKQWRALNTIVSGESGWDPCAVYPSTHNCAYQGSNSCGIPQATPCPTKWVGPAVRGPTRPGPVADRVRHPAVRRPRGRARIPQRERLVLTWARRSLRSLSSSSRAASR